MPKLSHSPFSSTYEKNILNLEIEHGMHYRAYYSCTGFFEKNDEDVTRIQDWLIGNIGIEYKDWITFMVVVSPAGTGTFYKAYSFKLESDATLFKLTWN